MALPGCGASPINIFPEAFWLGRNDEKPAPVQSRAEEQEIEPIVSVVDPRPRLDLNENQVVNADLKIPKSAEVKFPTCTGPVISRFQ